jgi:hypothetical protein
LPLEESAKFARALLPRVKTRKARRDLELLRERILTPSKRTAMPRRKAREALLS